MQCRHSSNNPITFDAFKNLSEMKKLKPGDSSKLPWGAELDAGKPGLELREPESGVGTLTSSATRRSWEF